MEGSFCRSSARPSRRVPTERRGEPGVEERGREGWKGEGGLEERVGVGWATVESARKKIVMGGKMQSQGVSL